MDCRKKEVCFLTKCLINYMETKRYQCFLASTSPLTIKKNENTKLWAHSLWYKVTLNNEFFCIPTLVN